MSEATFNRSLPPELIAELQFQREVLPKIRLEGEIALHRLMSVALSGTGKSGVVARFLLGLYNGPAYPFDLTDLRQLSQDLLNDCLSVLRMDHRPVKEIHAYFEDGNSVFKRLVESYIAVPKSKDLSKPDANSGDIYDSTRVVWNSLFLLKDSKDSNEANSLSVTRYGNRSVRVSVIQPGSDIEKEFDSPQAAYFWLRDFSKGKHLEIDPSCDFDFRAIVE